MTRYDRQLLATGLGLALVVAAGVGYTAGLPVWIAVLVLLLGLFLVFPDRITDFVKLVWDKLPTFRKG